MGPEVRSDPCSSLDIVTCSDDGTTISELHLGDRGLTGSLPESLADLVDLKYLQVAHNSLTGAVPSSLNYSQFQDCGFGSNGNDCCYFTSLVRGVYDESNETGISNLFDCPLPDGAAELCHAACGDSTAEAPGRSPPLAAMTLSAPLAEARRLLERQRGPSHDHDPAPRLRGTNKGRRSSDCRTCTAASNETYPQCDVDTSLLWNGSHISAAYCNDLYLIVWATATPNHDVKLAEIPKPPGSGQETGDFAVRVWNTQAYTYRVPLNPVIADSKTNYSGAGALAMMTNGACVLLAAW